MVVKLLFSIILLCQIDTSYYQYHTARYSTLLSSKTKHAEMTFSMERTIYEAGDTIEVIAKINNIANDTLLVWDPEYFGYERWQMLKELGQEVDCDLYAAWDGQGFAVYKLMKLFPGDSAVYKNYIVIDSSLKVDRLAGFELICGGIYFIYNKEFEYLTEGADSTRFIKSSHFVKFLFNACQSYIGNIYFGVVDKLEHISPY